MKTLIIVKYYPGTTHRNSRLKVTSFLGKTWFSFNSGDEDPHKDAAIKHIEKMKENSIVARAFNINKLEKIRSVESTSDVQAFIVTS